MRRPALCAEMNYELLAIRDRLAEHRDSALGIFMRRGEVLDLKVLWEEVNATFGLGFEGAEWPGHLRQPSGPDEPDSGVAAGGEGHSGKRSQPRLAGRLEHLAARMVRVLSIEFHQAVGEQEE